MKNVFKIIGCAIAFLLVAAIILTVFGKGLTLNTKADGIEKKLFSIEKTASDSIIIGVGKTEVILDTECFREFGKSFKSIFSR